MVSRCGSSDEQVGGNADAPSHARVGVFIVVRAFGVFGVFQGKLQGLVAGLRSMADFIAPMSFNPITGQDRTLGCSGGCWRRRTVWVFEGELGSGGEVAGG